MKNIVASFFALFSLVQLNAQSLSVTEMDTVLEVNSTSTADYSFSIKVENTSSTQLEVYVKRAYHAMNCAYDSGYFCWDFCYGSDIDNSIGSVLFQPGDIKSDFSGHVFSPSSGNTCMDSIRYVFYNGEDTNDSLSVWVTISAGPTMESVELSIVEHQVYPNPTRNLLNIEVQKEVEFTLYSTLGEKVKSIRLNKGKNAISVSNMANGIYLYSIDESSFKRLTISH
ncbi:MAG: T9SS type A sorting domain-containing protein [Bacteroidota bacterium]|nr:T9SS type A sorting domain-containing protein [Bacteroidota bacterium]